MIRFPHDVPGWLTEREGQKLAELAKDKVVLEIGSYCGRSTICLAQTAKKVHSLDWHRGDADTQTHHDTLPLLRHNLLKWNLTHNVVLHVGRIEDFHGLFLSGYFDMAFIDGAHDSESVERDCLLAAQALEVGGVIACHDFLDPRVRRAVESIFGAFSQDDLVDSLAWRLS